MGEARLALSGELDLATAPELLGTLAAVLAYRPALVVLDLGGLTFIDARSAGAIATAAMRMGDWGGTLVVLEPQRAVRRLFELCGFEDVLRPSRVLGRADRPPRRRIETLPAEPSRAPAMVGGAA